MALIRSILKKQFLAAITVTAAVTLANGCKSYLDNTSSEKGILVEHTGQPDGSVTHDYTIIETYENPENIQVEKTNQTSYGQCYWHYKKNSSDAWTQNQDDLLGEFCNPKTVGVSRVNEYMIDLHSVVTRVFSRRDEKSLSFWTGNQMTNGGRQAVCSAVLVGLGLALTAPESILTAAAITGGASGACEAISSMTMQQYDRMNGDPSAGGSEVSQLYEAIEADLRHGKSPTSPDAGALINNNIDTEPTTIGSSVIASPELDRRTGLITEFIAGAVNDLDKAIQGILVDYSKRQEQGVSASLLGVPRRITLIDPNVRFFVDCRGEYSEATRNEACQPIRCPVPADTQICKAFRSKKPSAKAK